MEQRETSDDDSDDDSDDECPGPGYEEELGIRSGQVWLIKQFLQFQKK